MSVPVQLTGGPTPWRLRFRHFIEDLFVAISGMKDET